MNDELFTPTIKVPPALSSPPWRPDSIVYPAFFGGPLAAMVLGLINGRRLSLGRAQLMLIAGAGVACFVARLVVTAALDASSGTRIIGAIAGVLTWLVIAALQRRPFRAFLHHDGTPASLVAPGFAAAIGLGVVEAILIFVVVL